MNATMRRIVFYGALFSVALFVANVTIEFMGDVVDSYARWMAGLLGVLTATTFPLLTKTDELAAIKNMPYRSLQRLKGKIRIISIRIKWRLYIGFVAAILMFVSVIVFGYVGGKLKILSLGSLYFLFFLGLFCLFINVSQYFSVRNLVSDLHDEVGQIKAREKFWKDDSHPV